MISANDHDQAATELRRPAAVKTGGELDARELVRFATLAASSQLRSHFESWLKLDGEHAMLIARFGHGPAAPFSPRRPMDDVIIQDRYESRAAAARAS